MCGETFVVSPANTVMLDPPEPIAFRPLDAISTADAKHLGGAQHCVRCGRPFRGEWDRYSSAQGAVCHVCANLMGLQDQDREPVYATPAVPAPERAPPFRLEEREPEREPRPSQGSLGDRFEEFKGTRQFRVLLYGAAFSVIAIAIFYSFFYTWPEDAGPMRVPGAEDQGEPRGRVGLALLGPPAELTEGQHHAIAILVFVVRIVLAFLPRFLAIYITMHMAGDMPGSTWWAAALHIGVVSIITGAISAYIIFVGGLVALYVLYEMYDLRLGDLVTFVVLNTVFGFLMIPVAHLVYGGLGLLLL